DAGVYREGAGDSADVVGLGMAAPRGRGDVDPAALRDSLPYRVLPIVIQQLPPSPALSRPLPPTLRRRPPPELSDGPHLSYVVQWFSFAAIIVLGSLTLMHQRATRAPHPRGTNNALSELYLGALARGVLASYRTPWAVSCAARKEPRRDASSVAPQESREGQLAPPAPSTRAQAHAARACGGGEGLRGLYGGLGGWSPPSPGAEPERSVYADDQVSAAPPQRPAYLRPRRTGVGGGGGTARSPGEPPAAGVVRARAPARGRAPAGAARWRRARDGHRGAAAVGGARVREPQARG